MLEQAYELLQRQYEQCRKIVKNDKYYSFYADEKWRHSLQVAGAGNFLLKRIEWLKNKDEDYVEMVKTAILLHDVCRFTEIVHKFRRDFSYDHGIGGAELLRNMPLFADMRIWLPIKHHGHIIEKLYEDSEYQNITDKALQEEIKNICFVIRDADKIANLHMLINEPKMHPLFWEKERVELPTDGVVSEIVKQNAFKYTTTPRFKGATVADRVIGMLSWYFDMNYVSAIDFCRKLGITDGLLKMLEDYCVDEDFKQKYRKYFIEGIKRKAYSK